MYTDEFFFSRLRSQILLNVGGKKFETSAQTLTKDSSYFRAMFSGNFGDHPEADGSYFIDRNPEFFGVVLDYLRRGRKHPIFICFIQFKGFRFLKIIQTENSKNC